MKKMRPEKIDHVHILVKDVEEAKKFFSDLFGLEFSPFPLESSDFDEMEKAGSQMGNTRTIKAVIDPLGIELIQPASADSPMARIIEKRGEGMVGFGFKVRDLEPWIERAKAKGIRIVAQLNDRGLREVHFHPKDLHGVFIELCEYEEKHPQYWASHGML
jgi:methylmalonyl-CoA epimerase